MRALISGITGQDGSYLAELLLCRGYEVHGILRRSSSFNTGRIDHIFDKLHLHHGDVTDASRTSQLIHQIKPDEVYNLAAQSHVKVSFDAPAYTTESIYLGTLNLLEACKGTPCRFYQASSSEMYGEVLESPQTERTPFNPVSPYAIAKVAAHQLAQLYRQIHGMHISCGILFNHESPRRGETFVTRKVTRGAARIYLGLQKYLFMGNLEAKRDWGYAQDYVEAMWLMLQQDTPDDYVIATGQTHSVSDFLDAAFDTLNLDWKSCVVIDEKYFRPAEVPLLLGDASKAQEKLGWEPKVDLKDLARLMISSDLELARREL